MLPSRVRRTGRGHSPFVLDPIVQIQNHVIDKLAKTTHAHRRGTIIGQSSGTGITDGRLVQVSNTGEGLIADQQNYPIGTAYLHTQVVGSPTSVSAGAATGSGGTASLLQGLDTRGTVSVTVGSGSVAGTLFTLNFTQAWPETPFAIVSWGSVAGNAPAPACSVSTTQLIVTVGAAVPAGGYSVNYIVISSAMAPQAGDDIHIQDSGPGNPLVMFGAKY